MNHTKTFLLPAVAMATLSLYAQPAKPLFELQPVLAPGVSIAGHVFQHDTTVDAASINDAGEVAFIAHWPRTGSGDAPAAVFTLHRLVMLAPGMIDGKRIVWIASDARVAISPSGVVAYEALYDGGDVYGIFVERHYALTPVEIPNLSSLDFTVDDNGKITLGTPPSAPLCSAEQSRPAATRGIRITPRLPRQIPFSLGQPQPTPPTKAAAFCNALPMLSSNAKGQVVIPVNTGAGPYLFIATPERR